MFKMGLNGLFVQLTFRKLKFRGPGVFDMSVAAMIPLTRYLIEKHSNGCPSQ